MQVMHVVRLTSICAIKSWQGITPVVNRSPFADGDKSTPKGRKHIGGGETSVYEKYQIHSAAKPQPN